MKQLLRMTIPLILLVLPSLVSANTIGSSTLEFQGLLTDNGGGVLTGTIAITEGSYYVTGGDGEAVSDAGGFDIYALEGGTAYYNSASQGPIGSDHDAYTVGDGGWGEWYDPDCADWYNYQLRLETDGWYLEYNANVGNDGIFTGASAAPMSGTMDWTTGFAAETASGAYYSGMGTPADPGAAAANGGGAGCWDMDWSWGSEVIPLEKAGFIVTTEDLGGGEYKVVFTPSDEALVDILPATSAPINCNDTITLQFHYTPTSSTPDGLRGYEILVDCSTELSFGATDIVDLGGLHNNGAETHYWNIEDNGDGTFTVVDAILGVTSGLSTAADLFEITFHPVTDGDATISMLSCKLRDLTNADISFSLSGATVEVDCTLPPAVTDLDADPAHEKIELTWTETGVEIDDTVEIYRGLWHDGNLLSVYPEYDDHATNTIPTRPADRAAAIASTEWVLVDSVVPGSGAFTDDTMAGRGIYYYEIFIVDMAANVGPPCAANTRATNYWLGDVATAYDGNVDVADVSALGAAFGTSHGETGWDNECDVGRTDTGGSYGIPLTDNDIDLEDLMIFAMNYGVVTPAKVDDSPNMPLLLAWNDQGNGQWVLRLEEPCTTLKGLRVTGRLPDGMLASCQRGHLLNTQNTPVFSANVDDNGLDFNLAVMGRGMGFAGHGDLLTLTLPAGFSIEDVAIVARDLQNENLAFAMDQAGATTPHRFSLARNYPNPFNPCTTISFELAEQQAVRLSVYTLAGRRVVTLVNEIRAAGHHDVVWDGRNDRGHMVASGTYFYRINAGANERTCKMTLMK